VYSVKEKELRLISYQCLKNISKQPKLVNDLRVILPLNSEFYYLTHKTTSFTEVSEV
jgi:hypothetical protein